MLCFNTSKMYKFNSHPVYPCRNKSRIHSIRKTRERTTSKSLIPQYIFASHTNSPRPLQDMNRQSQPVQQIINLDAKSTSRNDMLPNRTPRTPIMLGNPNPLRGYCWTTNQYNVCIRTNMPDTFRGDELLGCLEEWARRHQLVGVIRSLIKGHFDITNYTIAANVCREVSYLFCRMIA